MHDYTARIIHEDRTAQFRREADASRLAAEARQGQLRQRLPARIRRLVGLTFARWTERGVQPALSDQAPGKVMPAAD